MYASRWRIELVAGLLALTVAGAAFAQGGGAIEGSNPHGRAAGGDGTSGVFQPPEDTEQADATMAPGSIAVDLRDADDRPIVREVVTLGVLTNSIAKGDSRRHVQMPTDERGR